MNQKQLTEALGGVVEATVNKVGVDLNTASASLLEYVSGVRQDCKGNPGRGHQGSDNRCRKSGKIHGRLESSRS